MIDIHSAAFEDGYIEFNKNLISCLLLAIIEDTYSAVIDFGSQPAPYQSLQITDYPSDECTLDFPVGMFVWPKEENCRLASETWYGFIYNRSHPFSQWLIGNQKILLNDVPAIYDTLIRTMRLSWDEDKIRDTVNPILTRLRGYNGNCFGIHDGLFLTEDDFV